MTKPSRRQKRKQEALIRRWQKLANKLRDRNTPTPESDPDRRRGSDG